MDKVIDNIIIITHGIHGYPFHFWDGETVIQLSHCVNKRTLPQQKKAIIKNGRYGMCRGVFIYGKFRSLTWIRERLYPTIKVIYSPNNQDECPF